MNTYDKAKALEKKAKEKREREAEQNRHKFPILNSHFLKELCEVFNGKVVYVENDKDEWKGRK